MTAAAVAAELARALEALTERAFKRCLFPVEVELACSALDAYSRWQTENPAGEPTGLSSIKEETPAR